MPEKKKLVILMDQPYYTERKLALLKFLCAKLSIKREDWFHLYCCPKDKTLSKKKDLRRIELRGDLEKVKEEIAKAGEHIIVGLGRLPCEVLTGASILSSKAGACWDTKKWGTVWISYSPDAALYDPGLIVQISRTIMLAANQAGLDPKPAPNIPMFPFEEYEYKH